MICSCAYTWYKIVICLAYICIYFTSEARRDLPPSSRVMAQIPHEVVWSSVFAAKFPPKTEFFFRRSNISPWKGEEWWRNGRILKLLSFLMGKIIRICRIFMDFPLPPRESAHDWNSVPKARSPKSASHYAQSRIFGNLPRFTPKRCWNQLKPIGQQKLPIYVVNMTIPSGYD